MNCPSCNCPTEATREKSKGISLYGNVVEIEYDNYRCPSCSDSWMREYNMKISTFKDYFDEASN